MLCFGDLFLFSFFRLIITSFVTRCCFSCFCCCCCVSRVCFALVLLASLLCARLRVISRTEWTNPPIVTSYATTRRTDDDGDCRFAIWFHLTHQHTHTNAQHTRTHSGVSKSNQHVSYVPKRLPYRKRIETHHIVSVFGVETFSSVELVTCSVSSICYLSLYLPFSHFVSLSLSLAPIQISFVALHAERSQAFTTLNRIRCRLTSTLNLCKCILYVARGSSVQIQIHRYRYGCSDTSDNIVVHIISSLFSIIIITVLFPCLAHLFFFFVCVFGWFHSRKCCFFRLGGTF